jgi:sigma-70-like protein
LDELPPDQRAALSLLLRQRKSYGEVAALLGIPEHAVHDRAHAALAVIAPRLARGLTAERRQQIGDYLLGQEGASERMLTRAYLAGSEEGRTWAQAIAAELAPLASTPLPDIPTGVGPAAASAPRPGRGARSAPPLSPSIAAGVIEAPSSSSLPSSRLGGALLLVAILVAIVVAVILLSGGSGSSHNPKTTVASTSSTAAASTVASTPAVTQRLTIKSPDPRSRSIGVVEILTESGKRAFYIAAEHLPPSKGFFYAIWLYNSPSSSLPLSKSPPVGSNERLAGGALLPATAGEYREILLTRETSEHPTHPGHVILRGPFSLGGS